MSARNTLAGMPVKRSTSSTRDAGIRFHLETAVRCRPSATANTVDPPAREIASDSGVSEMAFMSGRIEQGSTGGKPFPRGGDVKSLFALKPPTAANMAPLMHMTKEQYRRFVGQNLRLAREALGMTQAEVCSLYGLKDKSKLSHWERGVHEPDILFIFQLHQTQRIDPNWIYLGDRSALPHSLAVSLAEVGTA